MLTVVLGCVLLAAPAEPDKEKLTKKELEKLQGAWKFVAAEKRGQKFEPGEELPTFNLVIDGTTLKVGGNEATFVIDPTTDPKLIDVTYTKEKFTLETIYRLDGDTLTLCYLPGNGKVKNRPVDFKTDEKSEVEIRVYKREKK